MLNAVWLIAKRDFKSGFSTPKTGAVIFFLVMMCAIFFAMFMSEFAKQAAGPMGMGGGGAIPPIQEIVGGLVFNLQFVLLLILPAITMGAFSEEVKTQSIRFLQTAPVRSMTVVLGKFLSRLLTLFVALGLCAVYPLYLMVFGNPDIPAVLAAYLGLVLMVSYQIAFGLWVSSMTSQQFMAFLFTMLGLFAFFLLEFIADSAGTGVTADVLKYLAPYGHFRSFVDGLITVKDVSYFLVMTVGFLFFTNVSYDSRRWR